MGGRRREGIGGREDNINLTRCRHSWRRPCLYFAPFVASILVASQQCETAANTEAEARDLQF